MAGKLVRVRDLRKQQKVGEILLEPIEISLDLLDILSESKNFCTRIWKFLQGNLSTSVSSGFRVWGRKIEIDLPESVSRGKDLLPPTRVVGSASVGSDLLSFVVWVESLEFECIGQH